MIHKISRLFILLNFKYLGEFCCHRESRSVGARLNFLGDFISRPNAPKTRPKNTMMSNSSLTNPQYAEHIPQSIESHEKRKRSTIACDECHRKRTKCDGRTPCSLCVKNMTYCTTSRKVGKRGPKAGHLERLESRVRILESLLTPEQWATLEKLESDKPSGNSIKGTHKVLCRFNFNNRKQARPKLTKIT